MSIGIIGEALIDMMPEATGALRPMVGGSPFNVVRALGRLDVPSCYLSPLSSDAFGDLLAEALVVEGVQVNNALRSAKPTSLAVVSKNAAGQPRYSLYRDGVADRDYSVEDLLSRFPADLDVIHTGSLAIVPADVERVRQILTQARARDILLSLDINMRPGVVDDMASYVAAVKSLFPLCDLVKASDEDLELLGLRGSPEAMCEQLLVQMGNSGLATITLGSHGAIARNSAGLVHQAGYAVAQVADTVGAGDCFQAGLLASLYDSGFLTRQRMPEAPSDVLAVAIRQGCATAAMNVMRDGCQPPTKAELGVFMSK